MEYKIDRVPCVVMDRDFRTLGEGELRSPPSTQNIRLEMLPGQANAAVRAGVVHVFPALDGMPPWTGRVLLLRGNDLILEPVEETASEASENLTVPVDFHTFVYPDTGGRLEVRASGLSCDGISFVTDRDLPLGGRFQVVIPITAEGPLILAGEILHRRADGDGIFYTSHFCGLCSDEEHRVREAVFRVQLNGAGRKREEVAAR